MICWLFAENIFDFLHKIKSKKFHIRQANLLPFVFIGKLKLILKEYQFPLYEFFAVFYLIKAFYYNKTQLQFSSTENENEFNQKNSYLMNIQQMMSFRKFKNPVCQIYKKSVNVSYQYIQDCYMSKDRKNSQATQSSQSCRVFCRHYGKRQKLDGFESNLACNKNEYNHQTNLDGYVNFETSMNQVTAKTTQYYLEMICSELDKQNISYKKAENDCYLILNLKEFMREETFDEQNILWKKLFYKYRVNLSNIVSNNASEFGFFKICPILDQQTMIEGLKRMIIALKDNYE